MKCIKEVLSSRLSAPAGLLWGEPVRATGEHGHLLDVAAATEERRHPLQPHPKTTMWRGAIATITSQQPNQREEP
jgi:hypothetical protein